MDPYFEYCEIKDFGGSIANIKKYQRKYVTYFKERGKVLDAGCGRGLFLELLREENISCEGVEANQDMYRIAKDKGFNVFRQDVFEFLKDKKDSYGGIFCSHFVEHYYPQEVIALIKLAHQALVCGGRFVIITPNFSDIYVATKGFWITPTHIRPYPLELLEKLLINYGFKIIAQGEDADRRAKYNLFQKPVYYLRKFIFGNYWGRGDNFIVGEKI